MRADREIPASVIVPIDAYERLCDADALTDKLFWMARPATSGATQAFDTVAEAFIGAFDFTRADEAGHVAYALSVALKVALHVAAQEARKDGLR